jgi:Ser/Thr protein kinase RdoA (MazF antagonist)
MIEKSLIDDCIKKIESITKTLPIVWNHGDHNPYNIFTDGLIDLEDSFDGPLGYDTITALTQNFRFPTE